MDSKTLFRNNVKPAMHPTIDGPPCIDDSTVQTPILNPAEIQEESEKFDTLVEKGGRVLFRAKAVFPFDFFPDTIVIDESKINIIHRLFFYSDETQSIIVQHVKDVVVDRALFLATLNILPDGFSENWVSVPYLWNSDAIRARRIIMGLLTGFKEGVNMTKVETPNFTKKIEALGAIN